VNHVTFIGGPLDGTVTHRQRFPVCLAEAGTTPLPANTYRRRNDLYVHQVRVPGDGTKRHAYVHASLPSTPEATP
jgi:hypothetical protein